MEIAGLALAVPGVIDIIIRGGEVVYEKINTFRTVDKTLAKYEALLHDTCPPRLIRNSFRETALDLKEGTLYFGLTTLRGASRDRLIPAAIKRQLDNILDRINADLALSKHGLSSVHEDTLLGKLTYTLWRGEGSKHQLDKQAEALKTSCGRLKDLCLQLHNFRSAQSCHFLASDTFKLRRETHDNHPGSTLPDSDILVALGTYADHGQRTTAQLILENRRLENDVRFLSAKLNEEALEGCAGILPVLGYRQPPYNEPDGTKIFQLVFRLHPDTVHESLAHWINTKAPPTVVERLNLCLQVAQAVRNVHAMDLVHKSLRPRAMLMLSNVNEPGSAASLFLQDWTYVREVSGATTQLGETVWQKAIYQHPARQGKYAETEYEPKHDIYSLGVCMLEILLWTPFVVSTPDLHGNSSFAVCELFERHGLALSEQNGGLPSRYQGNPVKLTSRPWATKTIWSDVARSKLVEMDLVKLVMGCLDAGFAKASDVVVCVENAIAAR
ncbi:hypothetical protein LTR17_003068 [Elasticomyces elasticus]|nr:hypothetical protein LTR17_003068 [Elasticomyces elasticus]